MLDMYHFLIIISATFPCTHCHQKKDDLDNEADAPLRDLTTLQHDFEAVESQDFTSQAKRANHSVSHKSFFNIPLNQVCYILFTLTYMYMIHLCLFVCLFFFCYFDMFCLLFFLYKCCMFHMIKFY